MYCIHERMKALIFNLRIFESLDTSCCKAIKMWVVFIAIKRIWQTYMHQFAELNQIYLHEDLCFVLYGYIMNHRTFFNIN